MTQTSTLKIELNSDLESALDLATGKVPLRYSKTSKLTDGVGKDKAETVFHDKRTLAASASEQFDLNGTLTDAFGNTINFTKIKTILIAASSSNGGDIQIGNSGVNAFLNWSGDATDLVNLAPDGVFLLHNPTANGYGVTAGTGDELKILNTDAGASVVYDIVVIGEIT